MPMTLRCRVCLVGEVVLLALLECAFTETYSGEDERGREGGERGRRKRQGGDERGGKEESGTGKAEKIRR